MFLNPFSATLSLVLDRGFSLPRKDVQVASPRVQQQQEESSSDEHENFQPVGRAALMTLSIPIFERYGRAFFVREYWDRPAAIIAVAGYIIYSLFTATRLTGLCRKCRNVRSQVRYPPLKR